MPKDWWICDGLMTFTTGPHVSLHIFNPFGWDCVGEWIWDLILSWWIGPDYFSMCFICSKLTPGYSISIGTHLESCLPLLTIAMPSLPCPSVLLNLKVPLACLSCSNLDSRKQYTKTAVNKGLTPMLKWCPSAIYFTGLCVKTTLPISGVGFFFTGDGLGFWILLLDGCMGRSACWVGREKKTGNYLSSEVITTLVIYIQWFFPGVVWSSFLPS